LSNLHFAPGESNVHTTKFSPSVILFWIKTEMGVTNTRVVSRRANTLLGVIPLGYAEETFPLANTAATAVDVKFSLGRAVFGLIFFLVSFQMLNNLFGWILLVLGISMLLNALSARLKITNNGGGSTFLQVSILEKAKMEQFRNEINARLFADHQGLRHQETMDMHTMNLLNQQAQINLQQQLNSNLGGNTQANVPPVPDSVPNR
jgi:hypothetical protein